MTGEKRCLTVKISYLGQSRIAALQVSNTTFVTQSQEMILSLLTPDLVIDVVYDSADGNE